MDHSETSSTHAHEVDNPTEIYSDFGEITTAAVAAQHVNDIIDTLIEVGANLEAAKNKPSSCGVSFEKTAAPDGGIGMTRQHSTRTILRPMQSSPPETARLWTPPATSRRCDHEGSTQGEHQRASRAANG